MFEMIDLHPKPADMVTLAIEGLKHSPKKLPSWFLYDDEGSKLFDKICQQPEYSLTSTETALLNQHSLDITAALGMGTLIEFGAGSARKVSALLQALPNPAYVALDISSKHLFHACSRLQKQFPLIPMLGICCDYSQLHTLDFHPLLSKSTNLGFFPGSSLGNFEPKDACVLLTHFRKLLGPKGKLLIGIDQPKEIHRLEAAYNDRAGISRAFAINLLKRLNRDLQGTFDINNFSYQARWIPEASHIEMALLSKRTHEVFVAGQPWCFSKGEALITETSVKYTKQSFIKLAADAGWKSCSCWSDQNDDLSLHLLV
jgi:L-histidine N-alpha-methyltransferase